MADVVKDLSTTFKGKRVLVTGDTGFKGSWLCLWLTELGAEVTGFALPPERADDHFNLLGLERLIRHVTGDIRDPRALAALALEVQPEFLFHLAAQPLVRRSYAEPKLTFDTNVGGSVNVLEAVRDTPSIRALVYITSDKCYRNREWLWGYRENDELGGRDPYSASKAAAELIFAAYVDSFFGSRPLFGAASVRAGNVIGGGDWAEHRIVPDCIRSLRKGEPVVLRNPAATRPWQHVLDPLCGYLMTASSLVRDPTSCTGSLNFGPDDHSIRTVHELASAVVSGWGSGTVRIEEDRNAPHEATLLHLNCDKAKRTLGWRPRWNFERSVAETVKWYREVTSGASAIDVSRRQIQAYGEDLHD